MVVAGTERENPLLLGLRSVIEVPGWGTPELWWSLVVAVARGGLSLSSPARKPVNLDDFRIPRRSTGPPRLGDVAVSRKWRRASLCLACSVLFFYFLSLSPFSVVVLTYSNRVAVGPRVQRQTAFPETERCSTKRINAFVFIAVVAAIVVADVFVVVVVVVVAAAEEPRALSRQGPFITDRTGRT